MLCVAASKTIPHSLLRLVRCSFSAHYVAYVLEKCSLRSCITREASNPSIYTIIAIIPLGELVMRRCCRRHHAHCGWVDWQSPQSNGWILNGRSAHIHGRIKNNVCIRACSCMAVLDGNDERLVACIQRPSCDTQIVWNGRHSAAPFTVLTCLSCNKEVEGRRKGRLRLAAITFVLPYSCARIPMISQSHSRGNTTLHASTPVRFRPHGWRIATHSFAVRAMQKRSPAKLIFVSAHSTSVGTFCYI